MEELIKRLRNVTTSPETCVAQAADALEAQQAELERERMRLAACGVVAMADTPDSAVDARNMHEDYKSASCDAVARRVDKCIALREQTKAQQARIAELLHYPNCWDTAAYPTVELALHEVIMSFRCSNDGCLAAHDAEIYKQGRACGIAEAAEGKVVMFSREGLATHDVEVRKAALLDAAEWFYNTDSEGRSIAKALTEMAEGEK